MLKHWGLKYNPFVIDAYLSNPYFTDDLSNIINSIDDEINQRGRLILILGDKGSGKTAIKMYLSHSLAKAGFNVISVDSKPQEDPEDGSSEASSIFADGLLDRLEKHIVDAKEKYVLLVDNAHYLKGHENHRKIVDWFQGFQLINRFFSRL